MSNAPPGLIINLPGIDPHDSERRRFDFLSYLLRNTHHKVKKKAINLVIISKLILRQ